MTADLQPALILDIIWFLNQPAHCTLMEPVNHILASEICSGKKVHIRVFIEVAKYYEADKLCVEAFLSHS